MSLGQGNISFLPGPNTGVFMIGVSAPANPTFVDGASLYFGNQQGAIDTNQSANAIPIIRPLRIVGAMIVGFAASTVGSAEGWSLYIRVNNTDNLIATVAQSVQKRVWQNNQLNISLVAGDTIIIKSIAPTWVTNPVSVRFFGYLICQ